MSVYYNTMVWNLRQTQTVGDKLQQNAENVRDILISAFAKECTKMLQIIGRDGLWRVTSMDEKEVM